MARGKRDLKRNPRLSSQRKGKLRLRMKQLNEKRRNKACDEMEKTAENVILQFEENSSFCFDIAKKDLAEAGCSSMNSIACNVFDDDSGKTADSKSSENNDVQISLDTTMSKDWSRQAIISIIELYKENSVLYDYKHPDYHNKNSRKEALNIISRELNLGLRPGTVPDDVKAKLANLRTVFTAEQHKIATYEKNDPTRNETYKPTLWWYDRMMFLKEFIVPRKISMNESPPSSSSGNNVSVKEEVFEIGEDDIKCVLLPSNTHEDMDESNDDSRMPQHQQQRMEKNSEQIFGDFVSNSIVHITDLQTRNKLKIQIMKAISDAQTEDDQNFGNHVTSSLLKIKSTNIKANAKSQITQILCDAQMEDMRN